MVQTTTNRKLNKEEEIVWIGHTFGNLKKETTNHLTKRHRKRNEGDLIPQERDRDDCDKQTTGPW